MSVGDYCLRDVKHMTELCCAMYGSIQMAALNRNHLPLTTIATVTTGDLNDGFWVEPHIYKGLITDQGVPALPLAG